MKNTSLFFFTLTIFLLSSCDAQTETSGLGGIPTKVTPLGDGTYAIGYKACNPSNGECYDYTYVTSESETANTITDRLLVNEIDSIYTLTHTDEVHGFYQGKQIF